MKKLILFAFIHFCVKSFGQSVTTIELNYRSKNYERPICLPYKSSVQFKITNVNPYRVSAETIIKNTTIDFDIPVQFQNLLSGTANDAPTNESSLRENFESQLVNFEEGMQAIKSDPKHKSFDFKTNRVVEVKVGRTKQKIINDTALLGKKIRELEIQIEILNKAIDEKAEIESLKTDFVKHFRAFCSSLNKLALYTSVENYLDSMTLDIYVPDSITLRKNIRDYLKLSINDGDEDSSLIRSKVVSELTTLDENYLLTKKAYEALAKKLKDEKVVLKGTLTDAKADIKLIIDSAHTTLERKKYFEEEFKFMVTKYAIINTEKARKDIVNKTNNGVNLYNKIQTTAFTIYIDDTEQLLSDVVELSPVLKNAKGDILKTFTVKNISTYGGMKVDFSSGYLLSFIGNDNYTNYYDATGVVGIQKNNKDDITQALGVMLHAYKRTCKDVKIGFTTGFSLPTNNTKIGFYLGGSVLMLEKSRLVITGGISMIKRNILNTANLTEVSNSNRYTFNNAQNRNIIYDEVYKPAAFVGLSYNIFTIKK